MPLRAALQDTLRGWREDIRSSLARCRPHCFAGIRRCRPHARIGAVGADLPGSARNGLPRRAGRRAHAPRLRWDRARGCALRDPGAGPLSLPRLRHRPGLRGRQLSPVGGSSDKMFSPSVRAFIQMILDARTGEARHAQGVAQWPATLAAIETGRGRSGGARGAGRSLGCLRRAAPQFIAHAHALPARGRSAPDAGPPAAPGAP